MYNLNTENKYNEKGTQEHTQEPEASQDAIQEWSLDALRNTPEVVSYYFHFLLLER